MANGSKSKRTIVYEALKKRIINNSLKPGEPLNEVLLAKELKTSTTPLREALQQLEREGFIENFPGRGSFVSRISTQDIRELFEIREILECEVVKKVVSQGLVREPRALAIRKEFESSSGKSRPTSRGQFTPGDQIHLFIFECLGNSRLLEYYRRLQEHIERNRLYFFSNFHEERSTQSYKEHLEMLDALLSRDPVRAERAVRTHLENATDYLKRIT
jgi:GntR family transcriptional regulator, rspAB operon transcriptional repressor